MSRGKTAKYDYPKEGNSLSEISQRMLGKSYQETTEAEARKVKKEINNPSKLKKLENVKGEFESFGELLSVRETGTESSFHR